MKTLPAKTQVLIENPKSLQKRNPLHLRNTHIEKTLKGKSLKYIPVMSVSSSL